MSRFGSVLIRAWMLGGSCLSLVSGTKRILFGQLQVPGSAAVPGPQQKERSLWLVVWAERPDLVWRQLRELKVEESQWVSTNCMSPVVVL